jgi:hypothetical protein
MEPKAIAKRKRIAKTLTEDAIRDGHKFGAGDDLKNYLSKEAVEMECDKDFFDVISDGDMLEFVFGVVNSSNDGDKVDTKALPLKPVPINELEMVAQPENCSCSNQVDPPTPPPEVPDPPEPNGMGQSAEEMESESEHNEKEDEYPTYENVSIQICSIPNQLTKVSHDRNHNSMQGSTVLAMAYSIS